jgi:hypothetical protein
MAYKTMSKRMLKLATTKYLVSGRPSIRAADHAGDTRWRVEHWIELADRARRPPEEGEQEKNHNQTDPEIGHRARQHAVSEHGTISNAPAACCGPHAEWHADQDSGTA